MKQYKVVDHRNRYRNNPSCEIISDNEKMFSIRKHETDDQGNKNIHAMILNPRHFHEERIVDEPEAVLLMLKGVRVEEVSK